jgi:AbrB family looped-hinge helix DNA binding protein
MNWTAKTDARGRITIPKAVLDAFGFSEADELEFMEQHGEVVMRRKADGLVFVFSNSTRRQPS